MKYFFLLLLLPVFSASAQTPWKIAGDRITTPWADKVNVDQPLPEYPRPQMQRSAWTNLNGLWEYAIRPTESGKPATWDGNILVPFAAESALSGVGRPVGAQNCLWYKRKFNAPVIAEGNRLLLHFGAVDWQCTIYLNGMEAGAHEGGYTAFSFDITDYLKKGEQEILIRVWDPADEGTQPRGKQVNKPGGIWYTSVTGIWQTAWLETVPTAHIEAVLPEADIDGNTLSVKTMTKASIAGDSIRVTVADNGKTIAVKTVPVNENAVLSWSTMQYWSPENPYLYDLNLQLRRKGKVIDEVRSYAALRKITLAPDANGTQRLMLNNKFLFQLGLLDQGWWPDGLYTAATDEALQYDIAQCKKMGFNLLRKHVKVEPARWYYHCDRLGMLVWQDMPSGDMADGDPGMANPAEETTEKVRSSMSEKTYRKELQAMLDEFRFFPCIVVWVPFNEAWGQFKTREITEWISAYDKTRLVNSASGGNFFETGDVHDFHHYPQPVMHKANWFGKDRALVLGEFGGLGLPLEGHTWQGKNNWGYQGFENADALQAKYSEYIDLLKTYIPRGLSGAIYTQVSDVEVEVNGLMTYDRKVTKISPERLAALHSVLFRN